MWCNELGGLTFSVAGRGFVKWVPVGSGLDLGREVERLRWVAPFATVPAVLDRGSDADGTWWSPRPSPVRAP